TRAKTRGGGGPARGTGVRDRPMRAPGTRVRLPHWPARPGAPAPGVRSLRKAVDKLPIRPRGANGRF
ncbi:hypothetical protein EG865_15380, partial [Enterococcus faecalis]